MGLEDRKARLRQDIARQARYLESLENMPDFDELDDGAVIGLVVTYGTSRGYPVIALKAAGKWYLTGEKSPNGVTGDELAEWAMSQGRHLRLAAEVGEFSVENIAAFDITSAILNAMRNGG